MELIIEMTEKQEAGLSYVASKEGMEARDYAQKVFGDVLDDYVRQMELEHENALIEKYRMLDPESKENLIKGIEQNIVIEKDISIAEVK